MDRAAIFIDAGYLFSAGSRLVANERLTRSQINLSYDAALKFFGQLVNELTGLPLLRIYWYDGSSTGPTSQQLALAYRPNVKLRLGYVTQHGEQRGVDTLMLNDLMTLSRNRAIADAVLLTDDEDLRVGMLQAQESGIRVHLVGIHPTRENQSSSLIQEADTSRELSLPEMQGFLSRAANPGHLVGHIPVHANGISVPQTEDGETPSSNAAGPLPSLASVALRIAAALSSEERNALVQDSGIVSVPSLIDRRLLVAGTQATGGLPLTPDQKRQIRAAFIEECRKLEKR